MKSPISILLLSATLALAEPPEAIQRITLDERVVITVPVATNRVTTISLPGPISAIDAVGVTADGKTPGQFQLAHTKGSSFLSVRAAARASSPRPTRRGRRRAHATYHQSHSVDAAQMINFTIPATGSSGHLGGGLILTVLLGPYAAFLAIASVLVVQALFFADGGLLALGCNIFNLGVLTAFVAYPLVYRPLAGRQPGSGRRLLAIVAAAVASLQLAAFGVVIETFLSGITALPFATFLALMQPIHLAIGLFEGVITAAIIAFIYRARPELLAEAAAEAASPEQIAEWVKQLDRSARTAWNGRSPGLPAASSWNSPRMRSTPGWRPFRRSSRCFPPLRPVPCTRQPGRVPR